MGLSVSQWQAWVKSRYFGAPVSRTTESGGYDKVYEIVEVLAARM